VEVRTLNLRKQALKENELTVDFRLCGNDKKEAKMMEMDSNHCQVAGRSLSGERAVDEQTFASLEVLGERLERLKALNNGFDGVTFSREVMELKAQNNTVAVR
jgi:hypothetical protein